MLSLLGRSWAAPCLVSLLSLLVLALPCAAQYPGGGYPGGGSSSVAHGTYVWDDGTNRSPTYSGGQVVVDNGSGPGGPIPYGPRNTSDWTGRSNGWGGQNPYDPNKKPLGVTCSGEITAHFTWKPDPSNPNEPPPASAVVQQDCMVQCYLSGGTGSTGSYATGLGQSGSGSGPYDTVYTRYGTKFTVQSKPGPSFSLSPGCSPSVSATVAPTGACGGLVEYSATATPAIITLIGTTLDSSKQDNILVGQNCIASLDIFNRPSALTMDTPEWSIPGNVFISFNISSDQSTGEAIPYPDPSPSAQPEIQPWFYWRDTGSISGSTPKTISATATVRDSSGNSIGTVTGTKTINVWVPDEYDTPPGSNGNYAANPKLGTVGIDANKGEVISNDPSGNSGGYDLQVAVVTPDLFTSGGTAFGDWAWLQLCQINETQGGSLNQMAIPELDSSFPFNMAASAGNGIPGTPNDAGKSQGGHPVYHLFSDSPSIQWKANDTALAFNNNFSLYVMYQPPDAGYGVNWVPLALYKWSFSANMTRSWVFGSWTPNPPGSVVNYGRSDFPSYPYWTSKYAP